MDKRCATCNADLSEQSRFRDLQGNYYCRECNPARNEERCSSCGRSLAGERTFLRQDGAIHCSDCFQAAGCRQDDAPLPPNAALPGDRPRPAPPASRKHAGAGEPSPSPGRDQPPSPGPPPRNRPTDALASEFPGPAGERDAITDPPEPGFGPGVLMLALLVGLLAGVFSGRILLLPLAAGAVCLIHWVLIRVSDSQPPR